MTTSPPDPALFLVPDDDHGQPAPRRAGRPRLGRHEKQVAAALNARKLNGPAQAAMAAGVRAAARALDVAEGSAGGKPNPYATAQLLRPYLELLQAAGLADGVVQDDGFGDAAGPELTGGGDDDEHVGPPAVGDSPDA